MFVHPLLVQINGITEKAIIENHLLAADGTQPYSKSNYSKQLIIIGKFSLFQLSQTEL